MVRIVLRPGVQVKTPAALFRDGGAFAEVLYATEAEARAAFAKQYKGTGGAGNADGSVSFDVEPAVAPFEAEPFAASFEAEPTKQDQFV